MNEPTIDDLAQRLVEAKNEETEARDARLQIEDAIVNFFGAKEEGTENFVGEHYTLTTVGSLTRSIPVDQFQPMKAGLEPCVFDDIVTLKPALNTANLKRLAVNDPESFRKAMRFISVKPAKVAVKVK